MTDTTRDKANTDAPTPAASVGVVVLAAGFSRRFGTVKLGATLSNGNTVFGQTLHHISQASNNILIVTRTELKDLLLRNGAPSQSLLICPDAEQGMGHTLACGIRAIQGWDACLVCLGDMPFIEPQTYRQLLTALTPHNIVVPEYAGQRGNPVGFGAHWFDQLLHPEGDNGGRELLRANPAFVDAVVVADPAVLQDIDTPQDLERHQSPD
jgi:molybdenum cofactor cytidylyltransferase